jgi:isochorismate synthase
LSQSKATLIQFFNYCTLNGLPFVFYRLPEEAVVKVVSQKHGTITSKTEANQKGFVFAPFTKDKTFKPVFITADIFAEAGKLSIPDLSVKKSGGPIKKVRSKHKPASKQEFKNLVKKIRVNIAKGKFAKVVAARVALKKKPNNFEPVKFFQRLCKKYPVAFVSLVYTPQYGLWIGATPEILLKANTGGFTTYSLAGTKANTKAALTESWGEKEKEEQELVSGFIVNAFKAVTNAAPKTVGPVTIAAGNLLHLRTTFLYKDLAISKWSDVVKRLHPTPAVAGLPRKKAIGFILQNEKSHRGFYSGYLGPVYLDAEVNLFVNLRCMQVLENNLALYVGCGVTKDSDPKAEWQESKIKTETLLNVL